MNHSDFDRWWTRAMAQRWSKFENATDVIKEDYFKALSKYDQEVLDEMIRLYVQSPKGDRAPNISACLEFARQATARHATRQERENQGPGAAQDLSPIAEREKRRSHFLAKAIAENKCGSGDPFVLHCYLESLARAVLCGNLTKFQEFYAKSYSSCTKGGKEDFAFTLGRRAKLSDDETGILLAQALCPQHEKLPDHFIFLSTEDIKRTGYVPCVPDRREGATPFAVIHDEELTAREAGLWSNPDSPDF